MKRIRIGLRLMLMITALFAMVFAWIGARRELERINARGELQGIQIYRDYTLKSGGQNYTSEAAWRSSLAEMDALIEKKRNELGDSEP